VASRLKSLTVKKYFGVVSLKGPFFQPLTLCFRPMLFKNSLRQQLKSFDTVSAVLLVVWFALFGLFTVTTVTTGIALPSIDEQLAMPYKAL
jgi:hypothetical protein